MTRRIAIVTVGRSDYSILQSVWRSLNQAGTDAGFIVAAGHLSPQHGMTEDVIKADGLPIFGRVHCTQDDDTPDAVAMSIGLATLGFVKAIRDAAPDAVVLLGDRHETMAAAVAISALPIPIAHIHGGEVTEGAVDERYRHAITKLSHLHFASTPGAAARLRQLGEEPWRIHVSGAPGIDGLLAAARMPASEAFEALGLEYFGPYLLVTLHPETIGDRTPEMTDALAGALMRLDLPVVITGANADAGGQAINARMQALCASLPRAQFITSCGPRLYPSMLADALAVVGNSSSGLIEAPAFGKPVVNIGERQAGRERSRHVLDCGYAVDQIVDAVRTALSDETARSLRGARSIYGDGAASDRIADVLAHAVFDEAMLRKRFADLVAPTDRMSA